MVSFVLRAVFWGATLIRGRRLFWSECQWRGAYFKAALASGKMVSNCEFVWDNYIHTMQLIEKLKLGKRSEPYFQSSNASNMELFAKKNWWLKTVNYFCKKLYFRCLTEFWLRLWRLPYYVFIEYHTNAVRKNSNLSKWNAFKNKGKHFIQISADHILSEAD